jgi:uncharacterized protein (DUF433 family)
MSTNITLNYGRKSSGIRSRDLTWELASSRLSQRSWSDDVKQARLALFEPWQKSVDIPKYELQWQDVALVAHETWIAERVYCAATMLRGSVDIDLEKRGGVPVVHGTRVPVATILAELAEDATLDEIAADFDLDASVLRTIIHGIAIHLDRPFVK